jgi:carbon monoxide dehydrogenase subunit G
MKVELQKSYPMPCSADVAWEFLQNVEAVAGCMPGAKITERLEDGRYKGTVTVRVGPATMSFRGEVEMKDVDPAARTLRLIGRGTDSTGSSGASMNLSARVEEAPGGLSTLVGASEVSMSGKAAAFGGRMMNTVADQILKQFADNFAAQVGAIQAQRSAGAAAGGGGAAAPAAPLPAAASASPELNGLALAWAVVKDWLRSLFGKKAA